MHTIFIVDTILANFQISPKLSLGPAFVLWPYRSSNRSKNFIARNISIGLEKPNWTSNAHRHNYSLLPSESVTLTKNGQAPSYEEVDLANINPLPWVPG